MTLPKLILDMDASSYTATFGDEMVSVQVAGGPSRVRRDFVGTPTIVAAQWVLSDIEYQYLMAFYRTVLVMGTLPFLMDMIIDYAEIGEFTCRLSPGTLLLNQKLGDSYMVQAQIEVTPIPTNADFDNALIALFGVYGDGLEPLLDILDSFTTITLPEFLPA